jgi:aryl-alcohol dehydrogenase-like predicted oxidoreductase
MIDTADVYSTWVPGNRGGESETIIGNWLKRRGRRDDVLIATKVGFMEGLSPARIAAGAEASLRRLRTDHIDLYYTHKDDPEIPFDEMLGALDRLVRAGKVRVIGASQISAPRLQESLRTSREAGLAEYQVLQTGYSLLDRGPFEESLRRTAIEQGLGVLTFYSLANGYLTGKYRSREDLGKSVRGARAAEYIAGNGPRILAAMDEVARETGATLAQIALAWTAAQPGVTAPLASATNVAQIEELLGAMELSLTPEQTGRLDAAARDD